MLGLAALVAAPLALSACAPRPQVYEVTEVDRPPDVMSDSLRNERARARVRYVQPAFPRPSVAPERSVDILDTKLDLAFDFGREAVLGVATHLLTPLRDSLASFELHAVGMEIERVDLLPGALGPRPVAGPSFEYDSLRIQITPATPLRLGQTYAFQVAYTAFPMRGGGKGELFNDGKGLYFIDAAGTDPYRPTQLWTQGEAEDNRRWFPTWDYPNDRMTFTIGLTLPDSLVSTSNGVLVSQTPAGDGMRLDTWRLDQTQVPYLASLSVGPYSIVEDVYMRPDSSTVPLAYYVEPEYEKRGRGHLRRDGRHDARARRLPHDAVSVAQLQAGRRARLHGGRHGEHDHDHAFRGHPDRRPRPARLRRPRPDRARARAPVVRRPRDDAQLGQPVAQRELRHVPRVRLPREDAGHGRGAGGGLRRPRRRT